ncbi:MAG: DUF3047 domain-containing protein [Deltaproteobacteria bacterium]|nr:DUF3047 domain-containing protein [Deltaproteobacteria bacterium]
MAAAGWRAATGLGLLVLLVASAAPATAPWREDFGATPPGWELRTKPNTKVTQFRVDPSGAAGSGVLVMEADDASATFATQLEGIDLRRTPILRWRWRVLSLPTRADGRDAARDDQAVALYVSHGGILGQRSIAYRWDTETPVGSEGTATYVAGVVKVHWITLRNAQDGVDTWFTEERDVAADFQRAFGFVPDDPIIAVSSNSQYTQSRAVAELDWVELGPDKGQLRRPQP